MDKVNPMSFVGEMGANMAWLAHEREKEAKQAPKPAEKLETKPEIKPESMEIDLGFTKLMVEKYADDTGVGFIIGMYDQFGDWQDIAGVGADLNTCKDTQFVRCYVWSNPNSEDYTHNFPIDQYYVPENNKHRK